MTNSNYTHYVLIIDRSGSMSSIRAVTENGIRSFIEEQQAVGGHATLSLYQFDHEHETVHSFAQLANVPAYFLLPRGSTALLDAIGFAFTKEGEKLAHMSEYVRPGKVVVVIATDGGENSSSEYKRSQIKDMITTQQDAYGWQVTYIGANQDSFAEAGDIGIVGAATMDYAATTRGTQSAWRGVSTASAGFASGQSATVCYTDDQRDAARDGA